MPTHINTFILQVGSSIPFRMGHQQFYRVVKAQQPSEETSCNNHQGGNRRSKRGDTYLKYPKKMYRPIRTRRSPAQVWPAVQLPPHIAMNPLSVGVSSYAEGVEMADATHKRKDTATSKAIKLFKKKKGRAKYSMRKKVNRVLNHYATIISFHNNAELGNNLLQLTHIFSSDIFFLGVY